MTTNLTQVAFHDGVPVLIDYVNSINGFSGREANEIEFRDAGAVIRYTTTAGVAPDPVITTEYTEFIPWSNVKDVRQSRVL